MDRSYINEKQFKQQLSEMNLKYAAVSRERDQYLYEIMETRNSKTYKLAQKLVALPRKIRGYKYRFGELPDYQKSYPYMLSVVIAVYNTADFLEEMIESILAQKQDILATYLRSNPDAQFREYVFWNIYELILVDDGSNDGSEEICDRYASKYPWIKVLHKENGGVSSARNAGIEIATGKYITFPDSDDKLDVNVFEACFTFFERHQDEISLVTYPLRFFDGQQGDHWTTYRFEQGTRILDMLKEWDKPQYFTAASFFKTEDLKDKLCYDSNLINGEDIKLVNDVLFQGKHAIGLIANCTYWYRRRSIGSQSAIQQSKSMGKYYLSYVRDMLEYLMHAADLTYGEIPKYIQYTVMGQLQWRLRSDGIGEEARKVIGEEGFRAYREAIKNLLRRLDIDVILSQRCLFREHLFYAASVRCDGKYEKEYDEDTYNIDYYFDGHKCTDASGCYVRFDFMCIESGMLKLEGRVANLEADVKTWAELSIVSKKPSSEKVDFSEITSEKYEFAYISEEDHNVRILDEIALYVRAFKIEIPLLSVLNCGEVSFWSEIDGRLISRKAIVMGKFMPITKEFSYSYYVGEKWVVRKKAETFRIWNTESIDNYIDFEAEFQNQIIASSEGNNPDIIYALEIRKNVISRKSWNSLGNNRKQIWLISDRYTVADDNGEALFTYLSGIVDDGIDVYFVIDKESVDYERLSRVGKVVAQDSREHHLLHMLADYIISSQADEYIWDPFWRRGRARDLFKDFYSNQKFVFLQHGVIKDDLSKWLDRYNKNIDGFICSAYKEADSILGYAYHYKPENVWLTGLPRFDRLYHNEQKLILVMPTWRKWLMKDYNAAASDKDATHVRDDIEETEFFKFYHGFLNDEKLLSACEQYGYRLCFMPHTNLRECMDKFVEDERVVTFDLDKKYRDAFAEGNLLITDYSSTPMDFVYLWKPVIYAQFDRDQFFSGGHTYDKGYFDYDRDGFGEVVHDIESLVNTTIDYMQNECKLHHPYDNRVEKFFKYNDQNNSQRVYEKIKELN